MSPKYCISFHVCFGWMSFLAPTTLYMHSFIHELLVHFLNSCEFHLLGIVAFFLLLHFTFLLVRITLSSLYLLHFYSIIFNPFLTPIIFPLSQDDEYSSLRRGKGFYLSVSGAEGKTNSLALCAILNGFCSCYSYWPLFFSISHLCYHSLWLGRIFVILVGFRHWGRGQLRPIPEFLIHAVLKIGNDVFHPFRIKEIGTNCALKYWPCANIWNNY